LLICTYIERVCAMQAADHGFTEVLTLTFPAAKAFEAKRNAAYVNAGRKGEHWRP
jgi:hypothetical protein